MKMKSMKSIMVKVLTTICIVIIKTASMLVCAAGTFVSLCADRGIRDWLIFLAGIAMIVLGVIGFYITDEKDVYDK